jgi:RNA polymerase sigma-70 factor (ECF subfamily)
MSLPDFEQLVATYHNALYRFALSLARTESEACDLTQQTFLLWATKGHQLRDSTRVKSWLFTTLHREFLAGQRKIVRFPHHDLEETESELPVVTPVGGENIDFQAVLDAIATVDVVYRAPVSLFYLEDYSYNEIADILGVPLGTIKSRISRGIAQLKERLTATLSNPELSHG